MEDLPHLEPRPSSVAVVRPLCEVIEDCCVPNHHNHTECLIGCGARWPAPNIETNVEGDWIP